MRKKLSLKDKIEESLVKLLDGDSTLSVEKKEDLRKDCLLAIKWEAVKQRGKDEKWGSAFANGETQDLAGDIDDE